MPLLFMQPCQLPFAFALPAPQSVATIRWKVDIWTWQQATLVLNLSPHNRSFHCICDCNCVIFSQNISYTVIVLQNLQHTTEAPTSQLHIWTWHQGTIASNLSPRNSSFHCIYDCIYPILYVYTHNIHISNSYLQYLSFKTLSTQVRPQLSTPAT